MTNPKNAAAQDQDLVALFAGLDTAGVSDAMDKLGLHGQALDIMPLDDYVRPVVGPAFTVKYVPAAMPPGTVGDVIDDVGPGDIVVASAARQIEAVEDAIRERLRQGAALREARAALGYHRLQRNA